MNVFLNNIATMFLINTLILICYFHIVRELNIELNIELII